MLESSTSAVARIITCGNSPSTLEFKGGPFLQQAPVCTGPVELGEVSAHLPADSSPPQPFHKL